MLHISGTTRLYGLIGDPLTASKSPQLWNRLFMEQGADAACVPFGVKGDDLSAFVTGARAVGNLSGLLVTMPHKQRMLDYVDELHPTARDVGAINVIRCNSDGRWIGANFDGIGCVLGMEWDGLHPAKKSVLLIGAGGAGRAIAFAVASAGARALTIFNANRSRAEDLIKSVNETTDCHATFGAPDPHKFEVVINATSLGMKPSDPLPLDPDRLKPGTIVVDIVNSVEPTPLYRAASERGCRIQNNRPMHEGQAVHTMRFLGFDYVPEGRSMQGIGLP
ncbi:shikimate dehydrogenase [Rhodoferax ferrireducens]|uniref:shikimate dehydrogenase (NADP(+)) n=1 Tax=Rhodoferax ferrireducens TaxID=192843 RepID=A0ABU2C299_9BURK|nr:shikimate dehydrogenase [Rhodoferax ferrireducens]MDR7375458.1 shikimate dehydrogenase [Rhodoferax ferrireducens]